MTKKLYRSREQKLIGGVCGGLAEYFSIDPIITRLAFLLITVATEVWPGLLIYILAWILIPAKGGELLVVEKKETKEEEKDNAKESV